MGKTYDQFFVHQNQNIYSGKYLTLTNVVGDSSQPSEQMEDQDIDPDIMNMVAAMCGDYSKTSNDSDNQ